MEHNEQLHGQLVTGHQQRTTKWKIHYTTTMQHTNKKDGSGGKTYG